MNGMDELIENIKQYFLNKSKTSSTSLAPDGLCPTCWGQDEWDNQCYEIVRDKHLLPNKDIYNSFINKIVDKHVITTHRHENKYVCITCDIML